MYKSTLPVDEQDKSRMEFHATKSNGDKRTCKSAEEVADFLGPTIYVIYRFLTHGKMVEYSRNCPSVFSVIKEQEITGNKITVSSCGMLKTEDGGWTMGSSTLNSQHRRVGLSYHINGTRVAEGKRFNHFMHDIVAKSFIGPMPVGYMVDHLNGDFMDNNVINLEYVTYKEGKRRTKERVEEYNTIKQRFNPKKEFVGKRVRKTTGGGVLVEEYININEASALSTVPIGKIRKSCASNVAVSGHVFSMVE